jgi:PIN domain nuclease of toxin-antitoxin system
MTSQYLLDTHVLLRWLFENRKLTREQSRVIDRAVGRSEFLSISAFSPIEIALLVSDGKLRLATSLREFLNDLDANPVIEMLPLTCDIALEFASLGVLRDPGDRMIVATARAHGLRLVTSDQRIIQSKLVPVVE